MRLFLRKLGAFSIGKAPTCTAKLRACAGSTTIQKRASARAKAALLPRHLPLIVTIGDNDLRALVAQEPQEVADVYRQSVAEELLQQREEALGKITELGGLALDVPAGQLSIEVVNKYLEVKERGLL